MAKINMVKPIAAILVLALLLTMPMTALAAAAPSGSALDSDGKVEFTKGGGTGGNGEETDGYDLLVVPGFDFGVIPIASGTIKKADIATAANYLKLSDRSGTRSGWRVLCKLTNFYIDDGVATEPHATNNSLPTSSITLKFLTADVTQHEDENTAAVLTTTGVTKPDVPLPATLKITSGPSAGTGATAAVKILSAKATVDPAALAGSGCWWVAMKADFEMAGSRATVGKHVANLIWTMENVPG